MTRWAVVAILLTLISGCSTPSVFSGGDSAGASLQASQIGDAVPRDEPRSRSGNRSPYQVRGQFYYVLDDARDYRARGDASWYGSAFHGNLTASGERYDMYAMTAAHRNLPLPTYVRVQRLDNGASVIVKVNDRGPFVEDRIIDLSYAAAAKLGIVERGVAEVEVTAINTKTSAPLGRTDVINARMPQPKETGSAQTQTQRHTAPAAPRAPVPVPTQTFQTLEQPARAALAPISTRPSNRALSAVQAPSPSAQQAAYVPAGGYWQVGAFAEQGNAMRVYQRLNSPLQGLVQVHQEASQSGAYRVRIGPFVSQHDMDVAGQRLQSLGYRNRAPVQLYRNAWHCIAGC